MRVGEILKRLMNLVVYFERPKPYEELPDVLKDAVRDFATEHKRLYNVHKDFFDVVLDEWDEILSAIKEIWKERPKGWHKTLYICFPNKLSRWTDICVRISTEKTKTGEGIAGIAVDRFYRPEKGATFMIQLEDPSEFRRKIEEFKKELKTAEWKVQIS